MKIKQKEMNRTLLVLLATILLISLVNAQIQLPEPILPQTPWELPSMHFYPYYLEDPASQYGFEPDMCNKTGMDFIVQIMPDACTPAPVRSDLLEEQNVPVFCRLTGVKINPLIQVPYIEKIEAKTEDRSPEIFSITYHPPKSALSFMSYMPPQNKNQLEGVPTMSNLGYLVIFLRQQPEESKMPDSVKIEETLKLTYTVARTFGINQNSFILTEESNEEWQENYKKYSFWDGKGYLKLDNIQQDKAKITVYKNTRQPIGSVTLREDETSREIKLPGFYCGAGVQIRVDEITIPKTRARLLINGEEELVGENEYILDSGCKVSKIYPSSTTFTGIIDIRCPTKKASLELKTLKATFQVNGQTELVEKSFGDYIKENEKYKYIGYIGRNKKQGEQGIIESFIIIFYQDSTNEIKTSKKNEIINIINDIVNEKREQGKNIEKTITTEIKNALEKRKHIGINVEFKDTLDTIGDHKLKTTTGLIEVTYSDNIEQAFTEAIESYESVETSYSLVPTEDGTIYGVKALRAAADLAATFNKKETQAKYLGRIIDEYNDVEANIAGTIDKARKDLARLLTTDPSKSTVVLPTKNGDYRFTLLSIEKPGRKSQEVIIEVDGEEGSYSLYSLIDDDDWRIEEIEENYIKIRCISTNCGTEQNKVDYGTLERITKGSVFITRDSIIKLREISLVKEVKVTVLPFESRRTTEANFTIQIGIEKRAIKLNPEKTHERIQQLNDLINKVEGVKNSLGKVVNVWKKACLVGGTALWAKNFLQGLDGSSLARKDVMQYWGDWCADKQNRISVGADTISGCYKAKQEEINNDVDKTKEAINLANDFVKEVKSKEGVVKKTGFLGFGKAVNEQRFFEEADKLIKTDKYKELRELTISYDNNELEINSVLDIKALKELGTLGTEDIKDAIYDLKLQKSCQENQVSEHICDKINVKNYEQFSYFGKLIKQAEDTNAAKELGVAFIPVVNIPGSVIIDVPSVQKIEDLNKNMISDGLISEFTGQDTILISGQGFVVLAAVEDVGQGNYMIKKAFPVEKVNGVFIKVKEENYDKTKFDTFVFNQISSIKVKDETKCTGNEIATSSREIKFWESGPYKGMVALMPIDTSKGYYVGTKGYSGFEGGLVAYPEISGNINTYTIGNVGPDKKIDFDFSTGVKKTGSDDCTDVISLQQNAEIHVSGASNPNQINERAKKCIREAVEEYQQGKRDIRTSCGTFKLGKPPTVRPTAQCEDFMSPKDCWLMYNLCDPVMCPTSRCDLGGRYPVDNVASTGIIGSLMLCWPNFENGKGVLVPICLDGVHAGLENLEVTLKLTRDCLQENIDTGKMTGICDQILSIYLCDFLWQNLDPLIKVGIPSLTESFTSRGGGEYALFSESWKNSVDSFEYFTQYYGLNTFQAFKERSTEQVGVEVCKRFMSVAYPTQAKFWEEISKPESPTTFFATLQELEGVAGTQSHYKIYYQIYAGQDQGVAYRVYLKSPADPGYYISPERYYVPQGYGYLAAGEYKAASPDFIAPQGYKEICVDINGQEHCGFGQVTTNFAIDELQNLYLEKQLEAKVTKTKDCISGAPTFIPAPTLNLQSAVQSTIEPAIYRRGIIRICASQDPGAGVDEDRYKLVGYCDDPEVGCYLDMNSVDDSISDLGIRADIAQQAEEKEINKFMEIEGLQDPTISRDLLTKAENEIKKKGGIKEIIEFLEQQVRQELEENEKVESRTNEAINIAVNNINSLINTFEEISSECIYDSEKARADFNIALLKEYQARIYGVEEIAIGEKELEKEIEPPSIPFIVLIEEEKLTVWPLEFFDGIKECFSPDYKSITISKNGKHNVRAIAGGEIVEQDYIGIDVLGSDYGEMIITIKHHDNLYSSYHGYFIPRFKVGDSVDEGEIFASVDTVLTFAIYEENPMYIRTTKKEVEAKNPFCYFDDEVLNQIKQCRKDIEECEKYAGLFNQWPLDINKYYILGSKGCFGYRTLDGGKDFTDGIDISAPEGTQVYAVADGEVFKIHEGCEYNCIFNTKEYCNCNGGVGNSVVIKHSDNLFSSYNHLKEVKIKTGDKINEGEIIGTVGSTGYSTAAHLDIKIYTSQNDIWRAHSGKHPLCFFSDEIRTKIEVPTGALTDSKNYVENKNLFGAEDGGCNPSAEYCSKFVSFEKEQLDCGEYNENNCENHLGCWWDPNWWLFSGGCRVCPNTCEGESKFFSDLKFGNIEECEETAKQQCDLDCKWKDNKCVTPNPLEQLVMMVQTFENNLDKYFKTTTFKITYYLDNMDDLRKKDYGDFKIKLESLKQEIENIIEFSEEIQIYSIKYPQMKEWKIKIENALLYISQEGTQVILVSGIEGVYDSDDKIIEYSDESKVCAVFVKENELFNDELAGIQIYYGGEQKIIQNLASTTEITWYKIEPILNHKDAGFTGAFPTITDDVLDETNKNYYWYQNVQSNSYYLSEGLDTIHYKQSAAGSGSCINVNSDSGVHRYRAKITINNEEYSSLGKLASEEKEQGEYSSIYNTKLDILIEPEAYDFENGGISKQIHRIVRKGNYEEEHQDYIFRYGTTKKQMLFMEYIEAHQGVVWIYGEKSWQAENFIGMDCPNLVSNPINKMVEDKYLNIAFSDPEVITADYLARNHGEYTQVYYYENDYGKIYEVFENSLTEVSLKIGPEDIHIGDIFLLTKGYTEEYPCYHVLILYEDNGNAVLDNEDIFIYMGKSGVTKTAYFKNIEVITTEKEVYFRVARIDELSE
jgi:hypothetical protein